jgi:methionine biosynthesis protein MetW
VRKLLPSIDNRTDLSVIAGWIAPGSAVLDLGCGDGSLLEYLIREKDVRGLGVDIDMEKIITCASRGIPVVEKNLDTALSAFKDQSYDYVILSQTIHQVERPDRLIKEILRIGKKAVVSFPNFGNLKLRLQLLLGGRMPKSHLLPYEWYQTPNIHMLTYRDFQAFCREKGIQILEKYHIMGNSYKPTLLMANLFSEGCVALIATSPGRS